MAVEYTGLFGGQNDSTQSGSLLGGLGGNAGLAALAALYGKVLKMTISVKKVGLRT